MTVVRQCPSCGLESAEVRCPRCNALKVVGCSGECGMCTTECRTSVPSPPVMHRPSDDAIDDPEHLGTPLER